MIKYSVTERRERGPWYWPFQRTLFYVQTEFGTLGPFADRDDATITAWQLGRMQ